MSWPALLVSLTLHAGEPCEAPRARDTAPLLTAIAQDKVVALSFLKAAGLCAERGEPCDQARLECAAVLSGTIQKQVAFDEGVWLRDMLLPYLGASYPMTRTFGPVTLAPDTSCNVDVATLEAAAQRRNAQAARREAVGQEYTAWGKWAQGQQQKCREQLAVDQAKAATTKAEAERLAAAAAVVTAAEALKQKQAQEAAAVRAEQERQAREAAEARAQKEREAKEAAVAAEKKQEEAERRAREEREQERKEAEARQEKLEAERKKEQKAAEAERKQEQKEAEAQRKQEQEEAEKKARAEKEEAERKVKQAEERRLIDARNTRVAEQREYKARIVREAEAALDLAKGQELAKKQAAIAAIDQSPAIAQAAVAEAAQAEQGRIAAEKQLFDARQKADAIVIDDSYERSRGAVSIAGGGAANAGGFGLGVLGLAHLGFWGDAPPEGMASGFEVRLWGQFLGQLAGPPAVIADSLLTARYFFGPFGVGLGGSVSASGPGLSTLGFGAGPSIGLTFMDTPQWRVGLNGTYLVLGGTIDPTRFKADVEVSWRFLTFQLHGGNQGMVQVPDGPMQAQWTLGLFVGLRASW